MTRTDVDFLFSLGLSSDEIYCGLSSEPGPWEQSLADVVESD